MRKRWLIAAAVSGTVVAATIWLWPPMPLWRDARFDDCQLLGFSPDNQLVYAACGSKRNNANATAPCLCRWSAATGELLGSLAIPFDERLSPVDVTISPDATTLLIGGDTGGFRGSQTYFLYYATTGQRRAGPIKYIEHLNPASYSPDGRWFWAYRADPANQWAGPDILDVKTG